MNSVVHFLQNNPTTIKTCITSICLTSEVLLAAAVGVVIVEAGTVEAHPVLFIKVFDSENMLTTSVLING